MSGTLTETESVPAGESVAERYATVRARIDAALERSGRAGRQVVLVAVTKYASIEQIRALLALGHADLGENRVQVLQQHAAQVGEYLERCQSIPSAAPEGLPREVRWHLIGHLQRNKAKKAAGLVRLVHSVDSLRLAEELQSVAAARLDHPLEVLVQVNVAGESQKYGVAPAAARHLVEQMDTMFNLRVRGLMCMAPIAEDPEASRPVFERAGELFEDIRTSGVGGEAFDLLSMGMTNDFEVAVECGANVVRVGSAIFGSHRGDPGDSTAGEDAEA